jgi:thiol-disulfide isomerase/thioredoxin
MHWTLNLQVDPADATVMLPVSLEVESGKSVVWIINGPERIQAGPMLDSENGAVIDFTHYGSRLEFENAGAMLPGDQAANGLWKKRRGPAEIAEVRFHGVRAEEPEWEDPLPWCGRWAVKFDGEDDLAVGVFQKAESSQRINGTFLTTTGDYRYLSGGVLQGRLQLSCFDGAHAFLFQAELQEDGTISGTFHSGNWYRTRWKAARNDEVQLPDAFQQTVATDRVALGDLRFPDVDGKVLALDDPRLQGRCRIIEIFGTWCPNCQDAGEYLRELHERYSARGLSITGLAFEMSGDQAEDAEQVRRFVARNKTPYPILIAGTSDKSGASQSLPIIDRVRSYPTMLFLDSGGKIVAIYTGFSGPATGEANTKLRRQFEAIIEGCLDK